MPGIEPTDSIPGIDLDSDELCPDPLVEFCDEHPWYAKLDTWLYSLSVEILFPTIIILAIVTGLVIKWVIG